MSSFTIHYSSRNHRGYFDKSLYMSQESQYSSRNQETRVDDEGRGGYRSHTNHYLSHNQGESGRLLYFQEILLEVMGELDISTRPANLPPKEDISGVMVKYMEVCPKRSKNRLC